MKRRWDLVPSHMVPVAIVAVCPMLVWLVLDHLGTPMYAFVGLVALLVAVYIGLWHPLWLYWGFAFTLAGLPFGIVPGVHVPLYLLFAAAIVLAAVLYRSPERRFHRMETAVLILVAVAAVSVVVTSLSLGGIFQYGKWAIVTLAAVALMRLSNKDLERFGRIFVCVSAANALWGILIVTIDKTQKSFFILKPFGYDIARVEAGVRNGQDQLINWAYGPDGSRSIRLGGTWVAGNGAGLAFLIAMAICVLLFYGWRRNCMLLVLSVALLLTQSRQAIFTLFVALMLVAVLHPMRARDRWYAAGVFATLTVVAFSVPYIRARMLTSLSSSDPGGAARRASLSDFPSLLGGHWTFGLGWARPEFKSGAVSYALNIISNTPLLHVYRSGLLTGLAFVAVCLIGCVIAYRAMGFRSLPFALHGGVFIAFCLVALQLDHGAADVPQTTLCFSVLLAFLVYIDRSMRAEACKEPGRTNELAVAASPLGAHLG
ncbi:O-antigen ligase domain-containing protein [Mycolicibacterium moriokaense]|nr:O-antigen ligase domain-containing protein [Mycolicibacterium moriokaense]